MLKFIAGFGVGIFVGYLFGLFIPIQFFIVACLVLMLAIIVLLFLFHLGIQDFQDYSS